VIYVLTVTYPHGTVASTSANGSSTPMGHGKFIDAFGASVR
jgi:hypothetical protein